jgi:hypothetical protein
MKTSLIGLAVLPFLIGAASAMQPLSEEQLEKITAGSSGLSSFTGILASLPSSLLSTALSSTSSSTVSSPDYVDSTSQAGLGEAGLTGAARLSEFVGVVQFLGHQ